MAGSQHPDNLTMSYALYKHACVHISHNIHVFITPTPINSIFQSHFFLTIQGLFLNYEMGHYYLTLSPSPSLQFTLPVSSPVRAHPAASRKASDSVYLYYKAHKFQVCTSCIHVHVCTSCIHVLCTCSTVVSITKPTNSRCVPAVNIPVLL